MQARTALPSSAQSVRAARRFLREALAAAGFDGDDGDVGDVAELLVSELVSNAVLHARSEIEIAVTVLGNTVRVDVQDGSPRGVVRRRHRLDSATGRGLMLVDRMAASWGVQPREQGKVVWFEVVAGAPEPEPDLDFYLSVDR